MKKLLFILLCGFALAGCNTKSPEQKILEEYNKQEQQYKEKQRLHSFYVDSLVNVAAGLDNPYETAKRKDALKKLRKEYPSMNNEWDAMETSIDNMEVYN